MRWPLGKDYPQELRRIIRTLVDADGWPWLIEQLDEEKSDALERLAHGVTSWEDYHYQRGYLIGLHKMIELVEDEHEEQEDEDAT